VIPIAEIKIAVREIGRRRRREVRLGPRATIADLLERLGYSRETVVVRRNRKIVVEEEGLYNGDSVEIIPVVTGG